MKEINKENFYQMMQSIDNYAKNTKTIPEHISLENMFMEKVLSMQKGGMKSYVSRLLKKTVITLFILLITYWLLENYIKTYEVSGFIIGGVIMSLMYWLYYTKPNYKKEMFLHRKEIAQELLIRCKEIISRLEFTHKQNQQRIDDIESKNVDGNEFSDETILGILNANITIQEKLDMYNTQKEFLEACLKKPLHKKTSWKPLWLEALDCVN